MIVLTDISKVFNAGKPNEFVAVDNVNLEIERGSVVVLKGPSGSGKTTLLGIIGCMIKPTRGRMWLRGMEFEFIEGQSSNGRVEITGLPENFLTQVRRRVFGFIFQQFHLIKGLSAVENVMIPAYPLGERMQDIRERAMKILESLSIDRKRAEKKVEYLSGGEAQRVTIARALINNPEVIIADEPTAHLDTRLSKDFMSVVHDLKSEGKTLIIASHDPIVFDSPFANRVINIRDGRLDGEWR
ncbi:MAG: ABC transporter ATP-binding protein [Nitrospirae bacterium]|nr:MAG: ABC transporter ATP-binding protein [Nitrospirota bacterium]